MLAEPSVVALSVNAGRLLAFGNEAKEMLGRTPANIQAVRPLKDGVIADYTTTLKLLKHIFSVSCPSRLPIRPKPTVLLVVPSGVTNVERRAFMQAAKEAGAGIAMTIEEPMAAAIGAGLPVSAPEGNMVVDIGGGTTDIAVLSLGGTVLSQSLRLGGNKMDEAIARHLRTAHSLMVGDATAEEIKIKLGSAWPSDQEIRMEVRGRDLLAGLPKTLEISSEEVREALAEPVRQINEKICQMLEETPPELAGDISRLGITLTGGGALLRGLDRQIAHSTDMSVHVADNALNCVALGAGKALEELDVIRDSGAVSTL